MGGHRYDFPSYNLFGYFNDWTFKELTEVYQIEQDFTTKVQTVFNEMIANKISENNQEK